jgi:hypothetical protein
MLGQLLGASGFGNLFRAKAMVSSRIPGVTADIDLGPHGQPPPQKRRVLGAAFVKP